MQVVEYAIVEVRPGKGDVTQCWNFEQTAKGSGG
jgi:hypothetical protein